MLETVAWISIALAISSALVIACDEYRYPQAMGVMNVVWPITALYFSAFAVWAYFKIGRTHTRQSTMVHDESTSDKPSKLTAAQVAVGTSHCGAGCMLADVVSEFAIAAAGITLLGSVLWAEYTLDFAAAWVLGVIFQYFAIKPMRDDLSIGAAVWTAIKADTLSILAFQVGMYVWMAFVHFKLAPQLTPFSPVYWLSMQAGMLLGFGTSYPMNRALIGLGLKEAM